MNKQSTIKKFKLLFPHEEIISIEKMRATDNDVYEINHRWICKSSKSKELAKNIDREAQLLQALAGKLSIQIPVVVHAQDNFIVYEKIQGKALDMATVWSLTEQQQQQLAYDIALFLYELHNSLPFKQVELLGFERSDWPWSPKKLREEIEKMDDDSLKQAFNCFMPHYEQLSHSNLSILERLSERRKLVHHDMSLHNMLIDEETGKLCGVIDFTDAALDDVYHDLRMRNRHCDKLVARIAGYYALLSGQVVDYKKIDILHVATEISRFFQDQSNNKVDKKGWVKLRLIMLIAMNASRMKRPNHIVLIKN